MLSMTASMTMTSASIYPPAGTHVTSYAEINVAPNPVGIGQTVTVNMYLAVPLETSELVQNMTLYITDPNGLKTTYGPFISDKTGGTYYDFTLTNLATTQSTGIIQDKLSQELQGQPVGQALSLTQAPVPLKLLPCSRNQ